MSHISSEGLAQEQRVLTDLCTTYIDRLQKRGITTQKLTEYTGLVQAMLEKGALAGQTISDKKQLTKSEETSRKELLKIISKIREGVKDTFPAGSPQLREFHVGDKPANSTALIIEWASDIAKAWLKYKDTLIAKGGLLQSDIDEMTAAAEALASTDTRQEIAKSKTSPEATAAFNDAMNAVKEAADFIHGKAEIEFSKDKSILLEFHNVKNLRFTAPAKAKPETPPAQPAPKPTN